MIGEPPALISYVDDHEQQCKIPVNQLYLQERILPRDKCDSILTKIIYSQAQFKAAEDNAVV